MSITLAKALLRDLLQAGMDAELDSLDVGFNDGVITPKPLAFYTSERQTIDAFPACEIAGLRSIPTGDSNVQDYTHHLIVFWTLVGEDEASLVTQVERCVLATRQLTFRTQLDTSLHSAPMVPGNEEYTMLGRTKNMAAPLVKGGAIQVSVRTLDDQF